MTTCLTILGAGSAARSLSIVAITGLSVGSLVMLVEAVPCMIATFSILCFGRRLVLIISLVNHCFYA